jgi:purine-binding chemotaxis protein CheW
VLHSQARSARRRRPARERRGPSIVDVVFDEIEYPATLLLAPPDILVFELGSARFALPSSHVCELFRAVTMVALPKAPPIIEGIINVRGRVVPVLDIRVRFKLPPKVPSHTDHFVLAQVKDRLVALRVDRAVDVVRVEPENLERTDGVARGIAYVAGVAKLPDGLVLIHDLATFLDVAERETLDEAVFAAELGGGA